MTETRKAFGRTIGKTVVNLGTGGEIDNDGQLPVEPPLLVTFQAQAEFRAVKNKIENDGRVTEQLILTVQSDSFRVLSTEELELQKQLPGQTSIDGDEVSKRRKGTSALKDK